MKQLKNCVKNYRYFFQIKKTVGLAYNIFEYINL